MALIDGFFPEPAFFTNLRAVVQAISGADLVLIGGGGLINDTYTSLSIPRYAVPALLGTLFRQAGCLVGPGRGAAEQPRAEASRAVAPAPFGLACSCATKSAGPTLTSHGVRCKPCMDLSALDPAATDASVPDDERSVGETLVVNFRDAAPELMTGRLRFLVAQLDRFDRIVLLSAEPCDDLVYLPMLERLRR